VKPTPLLRVLVLFLAAVVLGGGGAGGCGYSLVHYREAIPGAETLFIRPLSNETYEPGVETVVLDALRREALARGGLRLVDHPEGADLILAGKVRNLTISGRSFSSVVLVLEYEVNLGLELTVQRREGKPIPLDPRALNENDTYLASADIEAMRKNRSETIHRLAMILADRVYDSLYVSATP